MSEFKVEIVLGSVAAAQPNRCAIVYVEADDVEEATVIASVEAYGMFVERFGSTAAILSKRRTVLSCVKIALVLVVICLSATNAYGENYDRIGGYSLDQFGDDMVRQQQQEQQRQQERQQMYDRQFQDMEYSRRQNEINDRLQRLEERAP